MEFLPVYVGGAVFAAALPPRNEAALTAEQQAQLRKLLQSKNPEDLQKANKVKKVQTKKFTVDVRISAFSKHVRL